MIFVSSVVAFLFVLLEGSISSLPLLLVLFLCLLIVRRGWWVVPLALVSGIFLDAMQLRLMGETSLFLVLFLCLVLLYERKYEIDTLLFVLVASFFGTFFYLLFFGFHAVIIQSLVNCLVAVLFFLLLHVLERKQ